jgi:protein O-GlcNAc transferase
MRKAVDGARKSPVERFDWAMTQFKSGDRNTAAEVCRGLLKGNPAHAGANHLLGVVEYLDGRAARAEKLLRASLAAKPDAEAHCDLALSLKAQGHRADAEIELQRAITLNPNLWIAHCHLGRLLADRRDWAGAESSFQHAIALNPKFYDALSGLGMMLAGINRRAEALAFLERALAVRPSSAAVQNSIGIVLVELGRRADAETAFRRALELDQNLTGALCNLGSLLTDDGRPDEAESVLRRAVASNPGFGGARTALGKALTRLKRVDEAIEEYRHAVELEPSNVLAHCTLGVALAESRRFDEAEPVLRRAVEVDPQYAGARTNLGCMLVDAERGAEGESELRRALELDPSQYVAAYNLSMHLRNVRKLDEAETFARRVTALVPRFVPGHVNLANVLMAKGSGDIAPALNAYRKAIEIDPDCLIAHANLAYSNTFVSNDGYEVLAEATRFAARFEAPFRAREITYSNDKSPSRRLRVGYVSPDFRNHCQAMFMTPLLRHHDHDAFEIFCYSTIDKRDAVTTRLSACADVWRDVHALDDDQLAAQIVEDRIDVLIDLTMHMSRCRPQLFARRPAPVQIAWLAYPGTTGSSAIGYRLTDPWLDPVETKHLDDRYSEKSLRLPDTFWCYDPLTSEPSPGPLPFDTKGHITFGCLNNPCKLTDATFALWAQVMKQVEGSRLMLLVANGEARETVGATFSKLGIHPERITFLDYRPRDQYLLNYQQIDLLLDTFPYNGHTTSLDALWMGVPVVTIVGATPVSRAGYALLANVGLPELAGESADEFVRKAVELAHDASRLRALRSGLRDRMTRSPLMDGQRFARGMERAIRAAWRDWLSAEAN